jgi:iron complex transport system substrate-binding protein
MRFIGLAPRTLADIYADIAAIAALMGVPDRGHQVIAEMQLVINEIRIISTTDCSRSRVFCEEWGKPIIASQPWVAELVEIAGGEFLGQPGKTISAEAIAHLAPDVIIAAWCGAGDRVPLEKLVEQRGWRDLPAVRNARIFCISDEWLNTPATSLLHGLRAIAWALHPDRFPKPVGIRQLGNL